MKLQKLLYIFTLIEIATFALSVPVFAQITQNPSNSSESSCREIKVDTPVFQEPSTSSKAIRILPAKTKTSLAYIPVSGDRFVRIKSPTSGFIQTAVLKFCDPNSSNQKPWNKPTIGTTCRQVVQPEIVIRREPSTKGAYITTLYPNTVLVVNLTTNNLVKSYRSENYNWVEIDLARSFPGELSGNGWIVNTDLVNAPGLSSLAYCS